MHYVLSTILVVCLLMEGAAVAGAQQPASQPAPQTRLTLAEAITQGLARNRDLAVARFGVEVNRGKLQQARLYPFNPELLLDGDIGRGTLRDNGSEKSLAGGRIGLSQVLEVRGQRGLRTRVAELETVRAEWEVRDTEREVVAATMRAFSDLLLAQERLVLTREVVNLATQLKNTADDLVQAGAVPELDALRADVERRRVANRLTLEEASVSTAARALALLIGARSNTRLRVTGLLLFEPVKGTPEELSESARANRPDLKASEAALESAGASVRLVRAERFVPSVAVSASYSQVLDYESVNHRALLGISTPLPLLNRREGDLSAAEATVRREEAQRSRLLAQVEKEVSNAYEQFTAARRVVGEFVARIVPAQEKNARMIYEGYRLGEFRLTDALLAERDFFETRSAYLDAIAAYNTSLAEIYRATGLRP